MSIWWLSFSEEEGWLGCVIVEAQSFESAYFVASIAGVNPGGDVEGFDLTDALAENATPEGQAAFMALPRLRLLDREALEAAGVPTAVFPVVRFQD